MIVSQAAVIQPVVSATAVVATVATPWGFWSLVGPVVVLVDQLLWCCSHCLVSSRLMQLLHREARKCRRDVARWAAAETRWWFVA